MRIDRTELVSVRGADSKKIKVVGTSYIYMRDKASPSWRPVKAMIHNCNEKKTSFLFIRGCLAMLKR